MNLTYKEYTPPPQLKPFVNCFWVMQSDGSSTELSPIQSCFSSGKVEWIIHAKGQNSLCFNDNGAMAFPSAFFTGINQRATQYALYGQSEIFGIRLNPEAAMALFEMNLKCFCNGHIDADCLGKRDITDLNGLVKKAPNTEERIVQVGAFLLKQFETRKADQNFLIKALTILQNEDSIEIKDLSRRLFVGERQLQRRFQTEIGISPKSYFRVVRLYKAHQMGLENRYNFSDIAYFLGYSDPAHFSRDFKEYFGKSPAELFLGKTIKKIA